MTGLLTKKNSRKFRLLVILIGLPVIAMLFAAFLFGAGFLSSPQEHLIDYMDHVRKGEYQQM